MKLDAVNLQKSSIKCKRAILSKIHPEKPKNDPLCFHSSCKFESRPIKQQSVRSLVFIEVTCMSGYNLLC